MIRFVVVRQRIGGVDPVWAFDARNTGAAQIIAANVIPESQAERCRVLIESEWLELQQRSAA